MKIFGLENIRFPEIFLKNISGQTVLVSVPSFFSLGNDLPLIPQRKKQAGKKTSMAISAKLIWGEYSFLTLKSWIW